MVSHICFKSCLNDGSPMLLNTDCILSTAPGNGYLEASGTSVASAHVAGALAVLASNSHQGKVQKHYKMLINRGNYDYLDRNDGYKEPLLDMQKLPNARMVGDQCL